MEENQRIMMARALMGNGMGGKAADAMRLQPMYKQEVLDGKTDKSFDQWYQEYMQDQKQPIVKGL